MKGKSTLVVEEKTLVEAMQEYFNRAFIEGKAPVVVSVKPHGEGRAYGAGSQFSVEVQEAIPPAAGGVA